MSAAQNVGQLATRALGHCNDGEVGCVLVSVMTKKHLMATDSSSQI